MKGWPVDSRSAGNWEASKPGNKDGTQELKNGGVPWIIRAPSQSFL